MLLCVLALNRCKAVALLRCACENRAYTVTNTHREHRTCFADSRQMSGQDGKRAYSPDRDGHVNAEPARKRQRIDENAIEDGRAAAHAGEELDTEGIAARSRNVTLLWPDSSNLQMSFEF